MRILGLKLPGAGEGAKDEPRVAYAVLVFDIEREVLVKPGCRPPSLETLFLDEVVYCTGCAP